MSGLKYLTATVLSASSLVVLIFPGQAAATTVDQFLNKMSDDDENAYVLTMTRAAEKSLSDEGKPELARRVETLFADGERSSGGLEFGKAVLAFGEQEMVRQAGGEKSQDGPVLVEEMMVRELRRHQIALPPSFMVAAKAGKLKEMAAKQVRAAAAEQSEAFDTMLRDHEVNRLFNEGAIYIERG